MRPVILVIVLSTSVSFVVTESVRVVSSVPVEVKRSFCATGASLTQVIVIVPVAMFEVRGPKLSSAR